MVFGKISKKSRAEELFKGPHIRKIDYFIRIANTRVNFKKNEKQVRKKKNVKSRKKKLVVRLLFILKITICIESDGMRERKEKRNEEARKKSYDTHKRK